MKTALLGVALAAVGGGLISTASAQANLNETKAQRDKRMEWWREARFGMFIHWGLYAVPAGEWNGKTTNFIGEWIMNTLKIPVADYAKFADQFNPVKFDAEKWVLTAKQAGMKYIVITSKHHDGFAMFKSNASPYNIVDATPFKRDPLKELAAACKKHGMRLGFYYSQAQDWHHAGGAAAGGHWDPAQNGDMTEYIKTIAVPQVKEILTNYGPVSVLWWDTDIDMTKERAELLLPLLKLQPNIIMNNRLGGGYKGDTETPEQYVPATGFPGRDWETCMTMNDTWGFKSMDHNWKSTTTLLQHLVDIASKGGNFLLNVGPKADGTFPQESVDRLAEIGKWMKVNSESIYDTQPGPFKRGLPFGRVTTKGSTMYVHVFQWPKDGVLTLPMKAKVKSASLLADRKASVKATSTDSGVTLQIPAAAPDPIVSVIKLRLDGKAEAIPTVLRAAKDGTINLTASLAEVIGSSAQVEHEPEANIGYWTDPHDSVEWGFTVDRPGTYKVEMTYSCEAGNEGAEYEISVKGKTVNGKVEATSNWDDYRTVTVGSLNLSQSGNVKLTLKITKPGRGAVMNLRSIKLIP